MHPLTTELINTIAEMFTPDQRAAIEYRQDVEDQCIHVTLEEMLVAKYYNLFPFYPQITWRAKIAFILKGQMLNLAAIVNLHKYVETLADPDSFNKLITADTKTETINKALGLENINALKENLNYAVVTGGTSERTFDYKQRPK